VYMKGVQTKNLTSYLIYSKFQISRLKYFDT